MKPIYLLIVANFAISQISVAQQFNSEVQKNNSNPTIGFVENKGQIADHEGNLLPDVLFQSSGTGPQIFITTSGLTYVFHQYNSVTAKQDERNNPLNWSKLEMKLENATIQKENVIVENALPGFSNFYYAHCPQGILQVKSFRKVTIKNIYPGIDWVLNADEINGLSHDFIVHPGANPKQIKISYYGTNKNISLAENGLLTIISPYGKIIEGGLNVFGGNSLKNISANFILNDNQLSFSVGNYNTTDILVIDPPLQWSMPQASSNFDYGYAIVAAGDGSGDVLVTGESDGTDFPTMNAYQGFLNGFEDMVVVRLNSFGARLWATYYGGTDYETGKGVASDNTGNCYVTGITASSDMPVQSSLQANFGGGVYDALIAKFNSIGVRQWASWRGGTVNDYGTAIASDGAGFIYVTGYTNSTTFPTLTAMQSTKAVGYDAFVMKLNFSQVVQWCTFDGGNDEDKARGIAVDPLQTSIYVTGSTISSDFPSTVGSFQPSSGSAFNFEDAFIQKISSAQVVQFGSFCGGSDADFGQGIAVDINGNVFITGYTLSSNFPIANPGNGAYVDSTIGSPGTHDAFIMECNSTGNIRNWSTYFGGSSPDLGMSIAYDVPAGIYICGNTASTDFPVQQSFDNGFYQSVQGDGGSFNDMFIAWFDVNDSMNWSTYYGNTNGNEAYGICTDINSNIFVTGVDNNDLAVIKFNPGFPTAIPVEALNFYGFIYPNPIYEILNYNFSSADNGSIKMEIINVLGQTVKAEIRNVLVGENVIQLDLNDVNKGIYFLKISSVNGEQLVKFLKD